MTIGLITFLILVLLAAGVCLYASFSIRWSLFGKIFWHGRRDGRQIAITFDDGPDPRFTTEVLAILKREEVPATFFLVGKKLAAYPEVGHAIAAAGHELGFHGYTHRPLWLKSRRVLTEEVESSREVFQKVLGFKPKLFRPPYGIRGRRIMRMAESLGWRTIYWTRAGWDWTEISSQEVARRSLKGIRAGHILLLHDSDGPNVTGERRRTIDALPIIIGEIRARGFTFARVSEILPEKAEI